LPATFVGFHPDKLKHVGAGEFFGLVPEGAPPWKPAKAELRSPGQAE
jgi:hypothetical protein